MRYCIRGLLLLFVAGFVFSGCTSYINLIRPLPNEKLDLPKGDCPEFILENPAHSDNIKYHLEIARDSGFQDVLFSREDIRGLDYLPDSEISSLAESDSDCLFLPGGETYCWRVTGASLDKYGNKTDLFTCREPRSFVVKKRPTVRILVKIPPPDAKGNVVVDMEGESFEKDFQKDMEVGESVRFDVFLKKRDEVLLSAGGKIRILKSNETTKFGNVIVDSLTHENLKMMSEGEVLSWVFQLGKEDVADLKVGGRSDGHPAAE